MIVYYDFINERCGDLRDSIYITKKNFPFEIPDDDPDLIKLKNKYRSKALEKCEFQEIYEFSDIFI